MAKPVLVDLDFGSSSKVTGLPTPTLASDAVTKAYVDALPPVASVRAARIYRNTNQSIPTGASYTSLSWSTAAYETGGDFWTSGATTTIPETGIYQVTAEATFDTTGLITTTTCNMQILLNGATVIGEDEVMVVINAKGSLFTFAQRNFTAGDTLLVQVKHSDAGAVNIMTQGDHSPDIIFAKVGGAQGAAGAPAGATGDIQFNNAGVFGGAANVEIEGNNLKLVTTTTPTAPANGTIIFSKLMAGRNFPHFIGASNEPRPFQVNLLRSGTGIWMPSGNGTVAPGLFGFQTFNVTGFTATARAALTTNYFTRRRRQGYITAATAGAVGQFRAGNNLYTMGDGAGIGGFSMTIRFGCSDAAAVAGARQWMGMGSSSVAPTNVEPSTLVQRIGVGHGAADTNLKIFYGGSTAQTPIDLGVNFPVNTLSVDMYELSLYAPPNSAVCHYEVTRLNTGHVATGTLSGLAGTVLPNSTNMMNILGYRTNNATALACGWDVCSATVEMADE